MVNDQTGQALDEGFVPIVTDGEGDDQTTPDEPDWEQLVSRTDFPWDRVFQNPRGQSEVDRRAALASRSHVAQITQRIDQLETQITQQPSRYAEVAEDAQVLGWWNQADAEQQQEALTNPDKKQRIMKALSRAEMAQQVQSQPVSQQPDQRQALVGAMFNGVVEYVKGFNEFAAEDPQEVFRRNAGATYGETLHNIRADAERNRAAKPSEAQRRQEMAAQRSSQPSPQFGASKGSTDGSYTELLRRYADGSASPDEVAQFKQLKRQRR